jgi:histidinol phosphatase-like enzyme (inositol monophosphatase family)
VRTATDELGSLLDEAVDLVRRAGALTLRWFRAPDLAIETKLDDTPVTAADRAAERFVRAELAHAHPADGIVGEEEDDVAGTSGRRWVIDPIDGTKAFTRGVPLFSTLLALLDDTGPVLGVIHLPALDETVYAARGHGCWCDGARVTVSQGRTGLRGAYVMSSAVETWSPARLARLDAAGARLRTWGDAYGYALVATGRVEAMVDPTAALWDLAPMPVILSEAGGRFTTVEGGHDPAGGSGVGSCGGTLHDELLVVLAG